MKEEFLRQDLLLKYFSNTFLTLCTFNDEEVAVFAERLARYV
jgi:hypothetical protein